MTPEQILSIPPRVLTQSQREFYFTEGYILLEQIAIGNEWIAKLRAATEELVERSRAVTRSDHAVRSRAGPSRRCAAAAPGQQPDRAPSGLLGLMSISPCFADAVADLVGPDVKFHHSKLNFKWSKGGGGGQVALRHLVLAAYQLFTADRRHLPVRLRHVAGTARGSFHAATLIEPMLTQYDDAGNWVGCLAKEDVEADRRLEGRST